MGRPFMAPPNVPADRVKTLRDGFWATMQDKELLEEADKAKLEITPVRGEDIQQLVVDAYKVSPDIAKKAGELLK
jgi:tripartite-type tricarboxylate transporter receptor subunit TctC